VSATALVRGASSDGQLIALTEIHKTLASMTSIGDVKEARDSAEAIRTYCQRARKGLAAQNEAAYVKILAERRAGELLREIERSKGGRGKTDTTLVRVLAEAGIPSMTAQRWQVLSQLPAARLNALVKDIAESLTTDNPEELTSSMVLVEATAFIRQREPKGSDQSPPLSSQEAETDTEIGGSAERESSPDNPAAHRVAVMQSVAGLLQNAIDISDEIAELNFVARDLRQLYPKLERKINECRR
jgi:hypothetical protein